MLFCGGNPFVDPLYQVLLTNSVKRFVVVSTPRSGSTLLGQFLRSHPRVVMHPELLNSEEDLPSTEDGLLDYLETEFSVRIGAEGFKVHLEQLEKRSILIRNIIFGSQSITNTDIKSKHNHLPSRDISLLRMVRRLSLAFVVVMWRKNLLEQYVSHQIAERTGKWVSHDEERPMEVETVKVDPEAFQQYCNEQREGWKKVAQEVVHEVPVLFVAYEDLCVNNNACMEPLFRAMGLTSCSLHSDTQKQNPAALAEKVENWSMLSEKVHNATIDVPSLFRLPGLSPLPWWPEPEPLPPGHVSECYLFEFLLFFDW